VPATSGGLIHTIIEVSPTDEESYKNEKNMEEAPTDKIQVEEPSVSNKNIRKLAINGTTKTVNAEVHREPNIHGSEMNICQPLPEVV
jgi:hypothetical protein